MSALAQWLAGEGYSVSGSDRYFKPGEYNDTKAKLEEAGIQCFLQDGSGITAQTALVVVSTAIEDTVPEVQKAKSLNIPILRRSQLLALIGERKKTIAVGGTSGKSTTTAMLFQVLEYAGLQPGIISGAGLISIIKEGKIGNAKTGKGEWLVIEADESDGSIVQYKPEIGVLLNVDKDHKEIEELMDVFRTFKANTTNQFVVNQSHPLANKLSQNIAHDFSVDAHSGAGFIATSFEQHGLTISFRVNGVPLSCNKSVSTIWKTHWLPQPLQLLRGAPGSQCGCFKSYEGIYRRHQVLGEKDGVLLIDDYAHNPAKCAASIQACQYIAPKVIAWFQPHGYAPTRFLRNDFVQEIAAVLRPGDEIWMSEIFYAGGTAVKDISALDLINDLKALGEMLSLQRNETIFFRWQGLILHPVACCY